MFDFYGIPANVSFVLWGHLFIEPLPLEPELGFIISLPRAVINPVEIELPHAAQESSFDGNAVANLPAKAFGCSCAGDCALTIFHIVLPLLFRNIKFGIDAAPVIHVHCELGEEIPFVL